MRLVSTRSLVLGIVVSLATSLIACGPPDPAPATPSAASSPAEADAGASTETSAEPQAEVEALGAAVLAAGVPGGTYYDVYGAGLEEPVGRWMIERRATSGSTENLDLLVAGEVDLALAQLDVLASRVAEEPDVFGPLVVVRPLADECVFVAYRRDGNVQTFADLAQNQGERAARVSLGAAGGGMAATWNYIASLSPEHAQADIDEREGVVALEALAAGDVDAVAWITDPRNPEHATLKALLANPDLGLLDIADERLLSVRHGSFPVYSGRRVPVAGAPEVVVETICTPALLVASPDSPVGLIAAFGAGG